MPNHTYQPIIVTGINSGGSVAQEQILQAHERARKAFDPELVSPLTPVGHNSMQSFCIFPSGSGNERIEQTMHRTAVKNFVLWLGKSDLDFVALHWNDDDEDPSIVQSHVDHPALVSLPRV